MVLRCYRFGLVLLALTCLIQSTSCAQDLDKATFLELHRKVESKDEAWKTIPWEVDLLAAQEMAASSQKPIFMWAMDGHPLGCT